MAQASDAAFLSSFYCSWLGTVHPTIGTANIFSINSCNHVISVYTQPSPLMNKSAINTGRTTISITMNRDLLTRVRGMAFREKRSLSQQVELLVESHLATCAPVATPARKASRKGAAA